MPEEVKTIDRKYISSRLVLGGNGGIGGYT